MNRMRIFFAGVGGQGTLTATNLLGLVALEKGMEVTAGEIHGMAQRGGIVESTLLLGGYESPKIEKGEADVLLGFEPLETLRALPYLKKGGYIIWNLDPTYPVGVSTGMEKYPSLSYIEEKIKECSPDNYALHGMELAKEAGTVKCSNMVLLGAFCGLKISPFSLDDLAHGINTYMGEGIREINLRAIMLGKEAIERD